MNTRRLVSTAALLVVLAAFPALSEAAPPAASGLDAEARDLLDRSGVTGGVIVHLGCGEGALTATLGADERFVVEGLTTAVAGPFREKVWKTGRYGRVSVRSFSGSLLPHADRLVNLLLVEDPGEVSRSEQWRVVAPLGVLMTKGSDGWTREVKPWPDDMDDWSHSGHDADNNPVGRDRVVGLPFHLRWIGDPVWARHHDETPSVSAFVSSGGRIFAILDETPAGFTGGPETWRLVARDAFNGMLLWKKPVPEWGHAAWTTVKKGGYYGRFEHPHLLKRLVAGRKTVYATLGYNAPVSAMNAATGEVLWTAPGNGFVDELALDGETLYATCYARRQAPLQGGEKGQEKVIGAYDAETGEERWVTRAYAGVNPKTDHLGGLRHLFLSVGKEHVFVVDGEEVVAVSREDGKEAWRAAMPAESTTIFGYGYNTKGVCKLLASGKTLLVVQMVPGGLQKAKDKLKPAWDKPAHSVVRAYDVEKGETLWTAPAGVWGHYSLPDLFVIDEMVWVYIRSGRGLVGYDLRTGEKRSERSLEDAFNNKHHHRCYENRATERYLITSFRGLEYLPWDDEATHHDHWIRGGCQLGVFPCNGLTYAPPHPCDCYITSKLSGLLAVGETGRSSNPEEGQVKNELEKGPAFGKVEPGDGVGTDPADWSHYRHDGARSGSTSATLPGRLKRAWRVKLENGGLTAPTAAGDSIYVASMETHAVYSLEGSDGSVRWRHIAAGPVDTPPTLHGPLVVFGSRDGWVTCLRAGDGAPVWRVRAAPEDQTICAFGRLESSWPVHGSVLVKEGSVYAAAGRSSYLDGGIRHVRLDAFTGALQEESMVTGRRGEKTDWGRDPNMDYGLLADLLVEHGDRVFMKHRCLFGPAFEGATWSGPVASWAGFLDDAWFNRTCFTLEGVSWGNLVVFNDDIVCAARTNPVDTDSHNLFVPAETGYLLTATAREEGRKPRKGKWLGAKSPYPPEMIWERKVSMRPICMALTADVLFAAGTRDVIDQGTDPWNTYRGKRGGQLSAFSLETGETLMEMPLESAPVYDGMAAARDALVVSLRDGSVLCLRP